MHSECMKRGHQVTGGVEVDVLVEIMESTGRRDACTCAAYSLVLAKLSALNMSILDVVMNPF